MTFLDVVAEQSRQVQESLEARERARRAEWDRAVRGIVSELCDALTPAAAGWMSAPHEWMPGGALDNCVRCSYAEDHSVHG